jgi:hypothetical protein
MRHGTETLPEDLDARIWRYVDFTKFVHMLDRKSLFFCRPDCLDDRFEGTWGSASRKNIEEELRESIRKGGNVVGGLEHQLQGHRRNAAYMRQVVAVNCWHLNPYESAAMWKLYIYADQGIAIRSSVSKLIKSFPDDKNILIHVGMVKYIDFETDSIPSGNYLSPFLYKRKSFEHERELRAIASKAEIIETDTEFSMTVLDQPFTMPGENISVDIAMLIESIYLAPGSPDWISELVASVANHYGLSVPIVKSKLDDQPV